MSESKRVQRSRAKGSRLEPGAVCVSRGTRWGNPFPIDYPFTREDTVRMFRELVADRVAWHTSFPGDPRWESRDRYSAARMTSRRGAEVPTVEEIRAALAGKTLACWCPLDQPCHADVLLELANASKPTPESPDGREGAA